MCHVRYAGHLDLDRRGDLLLDFFGRAARPLRDYLDVVVGNVWIGFDGKIMEGHDSPAEEHHGKAEDEPAVVQRKIDETANHYWSAAFWSANTFATTCWPTSMPESISCILPGRLLPPRTATRRTLPSLPGTH